MGLGKASLAQIRQRPSRILLTGIAIAIATFFAAGTMLFTDTLRDEFIRSTVSVSEETDAVVDAVEEPWVLTDEQIQRVAAMPGVDQVAPSGSGVSIAIGRNNYVLRTSPVEGPLAMHMVEEGSAPGTDEVLLSRSLAEELDFAIGDQFEVVLYTEADQKTVTATLSGLVRDSPQGSYSVMTSEDTFVDWSETDGFYQLLVAGSQDEGDLVSAIQDDLGTSVLVNSGQQVRDEDMRSAARQADSIFLVLSIFVVIAMLAAAIIVASTYRILLARSRQRTAMLRCIGAHPGQIVRALLVEAVISGGLAGVSGALAAVGAGTAGLAIADLFVTATMPPLTVSVPSLLLCVLAAVLLSVVAAVFPAIKGARIPPVAAMSSAPLADSESRVGRLRTTLGVLLLLGALGLLALGLMMGTNEGQLFVLAVMASGVLLFGAVLAAGPLLVRIMTRLVERPAGAAGGIAGRLAARNTGRAPRRSATTASVFALGVTLVSAVLVGLSSMQAGADEQLRASMPADAMVSDFSNQEEVDGLLDQQLVDDLAAAPGVSAVTPLWETPLDVDYGTDVVEEWVSSVDVPAIPNLTRNIASGDFSEWGQGSVALYQRVADDHGLSVGDTVTVGAEGRTVELTVQAIYRQGGTLGFVSIHPDDLRTLMPDLDPFRLLIAADEAIELDALQQALEATVPIDPNLSLFYPAEEREAFEEIIGNLRLVALGLVGITVIVAMVGVATTLSLSVVERGQEYGLLRALGLRGGRLRSMLTWEGALLGVYATVIGITLGSAYAAMVASALSDVPMMAIPWGQLGAVLVAMIAMALLAALIPARKAARSSPMQALADD
ncbi:ABC transporter permease [Actinoalloteichus caeruleus]|uniref:ABC transporter permease n=1 Tax=Actinoalloteichus cyanogriseus TaxID=2893586 RepID=UPI003BB88A78